MQFKYLNYKLLINNKREIKQKQIERQKPCCCRRGIKKRGHGNNAYKPYILAVKLNTTHTHTYTQTKNVNY